MGLENAVLSAAQKVAGATGIAGTSDGILVSGSGAPMHNALTAVGTFVGNGSTTVTTQGWRADFVFVKSHSATNGAMWNSNINWHKRVDFFTATPSIGKNAIVTGELGVSFSDIANVNGETHSYFAYCDNGSGSLLQASYHGNAVNGRVLYPFGNRKLSAAILKRDSAQQAVYVFPGYSAKADGSPVTVSIGSDGALTVSSDPSVNQWETFFGEGCHIIGIPENSADWGAYTYTGTNALKRLPTPWDIDFGLVTPLVTAGGMVSHAYVSTLSSGQSLPVSAGALSNAIISGKSENGISVAGGQLSNESGKQYGFIFCRRARSGSLLQKLATPLRTKKSIQCDSGYIDCGTVPASLTGDAAHTVEWFGAVSGAVVTLVGMTNGTGIDNESGKQFPLIFASDGADRTAGSVSFGMELMAAQIYQPDFAGDPWLGATVAIATNSNWRLRYSTDGGTNLDEYPLNTGIRYEQSIVHYAYTYEGNGVFKFFVNGVLVKLRDRNLVGGNISMNPAHRIFIGARKRASATPDHTSSFQFRGARLYGRALTAEEVAANYRSFKFGGGAAAAGALREWLPENASGSTLIESVAGGSCAITNGAVLA